MQSIRTLCVANHATRHLLEEVLRQLPQCEVVAWVEPDAMEEAIGSILPDLLLAVPNRESMARESQIAYIKDERIAPLDSEFVAIPSHDSILLFEADSIIRLRAEGSYVRIMFTDRPDLVIAKTIGDCERGLPEELFARVHRSNIVNIRHIRRIERGRPTLLVLTNTDEVEVSDTHREALLALLPKPIRSKRPK